MKTFLMWGGAIALIAFGVMSSSSASDKIGSYWNSASGSRSSSGGFRGLDSSRLSHDDYENAVRAMGTRSGGPFWNVRSRTDAEHIAERRAEHNYLKELGELFDSNAELRKKHGSSIFGY